MGIQFEVEFNDEEIAQLAIMATRAIQRAQQLIAIEVWGGIGREAPTDHGKLAGDWTVEAINNTDWRIYTNTEYALWVHDGTGIYGPTGSPIVPASASVLVFEWQGQTWYLRSVKGQRPNPYADRAMATAEARTDEFINMALAEMGG